MSTDSQHLRAARRVYRVGRTPSPIAGTPVDPGVTAQDRRVAVALLARFAAPSPSTGDQP